MASVFIAPLIGLSKKFKVSPSKLLMPMAFSSLMGGTCTLIGTSTNVAGSSFLSQKGFEPIGMFELLPVALPIIIIGILFMVSIGKKMLPNFQPEEMQTDKFRRKYVSEVIVNENSSVIGTKFKEYQTKFENIKFDELVRNGQIILPTYSTKIESGDIILLQMDKEKLMPFITSENFSLRQVALSLIHI